MITSYTTKKFYLKTTVALTKHYGEIMCKNNHEKWK